MSLHFRTCYPYESWWQMEPTTTGAAVVPSFFFLNHIVLLVHKNHVVSSSKERVWCITQLALWNRVSTIQSVVLTADVFQLFIKYFLRLTSLSGRIRTKFFFCFMQFFPRWMFWGTRRWCVSWILYVRGYSCRRSVSYGIHSYRCGSVSWCLWLLRLNILCLCVLSLLALLLVHYTETHTSV